jgi:hypothetical protein
MWLLLQNTGVKLRIMRIRTLTRAVLRNRIRRQTLEKAGKVRGPHQFPFPELESKPHQIYAAQQHLSAYLVRVLCGGIDHKYLLHDGITHIQTTTILVQLLRTCTHTSNHQTIS